MNLIKLTTFNDLINLINYHRITAMNPQNAQPIVPMKNRNLILSILVAVGICASVIYAAPPPGKGPNKGGGGDDSTPSLDHRGLQDGLIQMGTSGGWGQDLANGYCCAGTLGSLVEDGNGNIYILSNYHVLAADIVNGGNGVLTTLGSSIIHPGLIDVGCDASNSIDVAGFARAALPLVSAGTHDLALYAAANVDAAIALVDPGVVDETGAILGIGTISSNTVDAFSRQRVKKSGRTTGFSKSRVSGLNATIRVSYENECAGGTIGTATFTGQIVIENKGSKFLAGGDSGSLMMEDVDTNPRAVGLLFAGSNRTAIANPIQEVLSVLNVSMVGIETESSSSAETSNESSSQRARFASARAAQNRASAGLMNARGVVGHAVGQGANNQPVIKVYVESISGYDRSKVPAFVDGIRVVVEETGKIVAF